uniref:Uncharacterized protein n=1 Tax=Oryza brachyantha TaxID=4533 RepID=J3N940_ORYBR
MEEKLTEEEWKTGAGTGSGRGCAADCGGYGNRYEYLGYGNKYELSRIRIRIGCNRTRI